MSWDTDSSSSGLSTPRSLSPSPFSTPLTPVDPVGGFEVFEVSPGTPCRVGRLQNSSIGLPIRAKKPPAPVEQTEDLLEDIKKRRDIFFAAYQDVLSPLLPDDHLVYGNSWSEQIRPYKSMSQPKGLQAILKPYQFEGLSFLVHLRENGMNGILADEMGLGKTLQTLSLFQHVRESNNSTCVNAPFLVICPLSVIDSWASEASKWVPTLSVLKYNGTREERAKIKTTIARQRRSRTVPDLVVASYDTVMSDITWFRRAFVWKYIVLDEGHRIKNSESKKAQLLDKIRTEFKLVLTGTPVQNDLRELWSVLHWLYPDLFDRPTADRFEEAFSLNEGKVDLQFLESCKRFLELVMLRRTKESSGIGLELPPKTEIALSVPLSRFQHASYLNILTGVDQLLDKPDSSAPVDNNLQKVQKRMTMGNLLMELRKVSIHPYLLDGEYPDREPGEHTIVHSGKFIILQKIIQKIVVEDKKKVIIFSNFDHSLSLCEDLLTTFRDNGSRFEHARLDGKTSSSWRRLLVHLFTTDPRYMVFLVSIRAGGEGLNLTSSSVVVFLDSDWNPQVMHQAEARVHRIGQKHPVSIFKLYSRGTVEEQMHRRLTKKAYLAAVVTGNVQPCFTHPINFECTDDTESNASLITSFARQNVGSSYHHGVDAHELTAWDLSTIVEKCSAERKEDPVKTQTVDQEQQWLGCGAGIRTNLFNGAMIDRKSRGFSIYDQITQAARSERRIGKRRVVLVDGFEVTKENLALDPSEDMTEDSSESDADEEMADEIACFVCKGPAAAECRVCPRAFHQKCLEMSCPSYDTCASQRFLCPHHYCCKCEKTASQAGRLLLCCQLCVKAFCEQCLDWEQTVFIGKNPNYGETGLHPSSSFFIKCTSCTSLARKRGLPAEKTDKSKRVKI